MRLVWQLLAVAAVAFVGGQAVAAVEGNPWLTLVVGARDGRAGGARLRGGWCGAPSAARPTEVARTGAAAAARPRDADRRRACSRPSSSTSPSSAATRSTGWGSVTGALGLLGFMAAAAVTEELLFRGVLFRIIEERIGTWIALVLTGVVFGLSHLVNPDASLWGATAIAIEAGGMLAAAYAATRNLWVPIGLHFGWNFAAGGIFSTEVSGNGSRQGLLDAATSGPTLLTGGDFGPEGSLYAVLAGVLLTVGVPVAGPPARAHRARAAGARPADSGDRYSSPGDRAPAAPGAVAAARRHGPGSPVRAAPRSLASLRAGAARPRHAARRPAGPPVRRAGRRGGRPGVPAAGRAPAVAGRLPRPGVARLRRSTSSAATTPSRAPHCPSRC